MKLRFLHNRENVKEKEIVTVKKFLALGCFVLKKTILL